jgi:hypothetical protein
VIKRLGIASRLLSTTRTPDQATGSAVMCAIWVSRVMAYRSEIAAGATNSAREIQVAAIRDTYHINVLLIVIALAVAVWGWMQERGQLVETRVRPRAPVVIE